MTSCSLFLPDADYIVDLEGLIEYLGAKVGEGNICLWCNRAFRYSKKPSLHKGAIHLRAEISGQARISVSGPKFQAEILMTTRQVTQIIYIVRYVVRFWTDLLLQRNCLRLPLCSPHRHIQMRNLLGRLDLKTFDWRPVGRSGSNDVRPESGYLPQTEGRTWACSERKPIVKPIVRNS